MPALSTLALQSLSLTVSHLVVSAAPLLSAIRIGPNRHVTGLFCEGNVIVTIDRELPSLDVYTVVLSSGHLVAARPRQRDTNCNLAVLRLETPRPVVNLAMATSSIGNMTVVIGADAEASPTVRLTVVHRFLRTPDGPMPVLDLPGHGLDPGSLVLDADGCLIGMAAFAPSGEVVAIPGAVIGRVLVPILGLEAPHAAPTSSRPGWLGVELQPITVPDALAARVGQASGRMVVSITQGGPAERAGLRLGDVLLALDGTSASRPHALRAFLGRGRIGSSVEVRLLRDGNVLIARLTIADQPG